MFFKKKNTIWAWTCNGKWIQIEKVEKQMDDFLQRISKLEDIKVSKKRYYTKRHSRGNITYIYVKIKYSEKLREEVWYHCYATNVVLSENPPC